MHPCTLKPMALGAGGGSEGEVCAEGWGGTMGRGGGIRKIGGVVDCTGGGGAGEELWGPEDIYVCRMPLCLDGCMIGTSAFKCIFMGTGTPLPSSRPSTYAHGEQECFCRHHGANNNIGSLVSRSASARISSLSPLMVGGQQFTTNWV